VTAAIVFTGPTLPTAEAAALLPATILPPARQGDIWRAVHEHRPVVIALIDGVFLHDPAVWHREILWALTEGVHVFGAASMGALRAAELAPFGMQGVGKVFEAYRDGIWPGFAEPFEDDDEVAVIHAPAELAHKPLSDAMVDLRDTLRAAADAGLLTAPEALAITTQLKALPFGERSIARLVALAADTLDQATTTNLRAWLPHGTVARKRLDALALLDKLRQFLADRPAPFAAPFRFEYVQAWHDFVTAGDALALDETLVLEEARLRTDDWHDTARAALGRLCAIAAAPEPRSDDARLALDRFRLARGLTRRADLDAWLAGNAATAEWLRRAVRDEAGISASLTLPPPGLDNAIIDHLRLTGRFAELLQRAQAKHAKLAERPAPEPGPLLDAALGWYAERSNWDGSTPAPFGWTDEAAFRLAVWREYTFVRAQA
jgi:hypothetical protein